MNITLPDPHLFAHAWIPSPTKLVLNDMWVWLILLGLPIILLGVIRRHYKHRSFFGTTLALTGTLPLLIGILGGCLTFWFNHVPPKPSTNNQTWTYKQDDNHQFETTPNKANKAGYIAPKRDSQDDAYYVNTLIEKHYGLIAQNGYLMPSMNLKISDIPNSKSIYVFNNTAYICSFSATNVNKNKQGYYNNLTLNKATCINGPLSININPN